MNRFCLGFYVLHHSRALCSWCWHLSLVLFHLIWNLDSWIIFFWNLNVSVLCGCGFYGRLLFWLDLCDTTQLGRKKAGDNVCEDTVEGLWPPWHLRVEVSVLLWLDLKWSTLSMISKDRSLIHKTHIVKDKTISHKLSSGFTMHMTKACMTDRW